MRPDRGRDGDLSRIADYIGWGRPACLGRRPDFMTFANRRPIYLLGRKLGSFCKINVCGAAATETASNHSFKQRTIPYFAYDVKAPAGPPRLL